MAVTKHRCTSMKCTVMSSWLISPHYTRGAVSRGVLGRPPRQRMSANVVADEAHCLYAFDVLAAHFHADQPEPKPPFPVDVACPLFVTWNKRMSRSMQLQLRGCIGCLKPLLLSSIRDYALTSALRDRRFPPIELRELPSLHCTVQLLGGFEPCALYDWTIGVHGLTISFVDRATNGTARSAVYLPDVIPEQGWSKVEAIDSLIRKAGCEQSITENLRASLQVCRFVSTKCSVSYDQWASARRAHNGNGAQMNGHHGSLTNGRGTQLYGHASNSVHRQAHGEHANGVRGHATNGARANTQNGHSYSAAAAPTTAPGLSTPYNVAAHPPPAPPPASTQAPPPVAAPSGPLSIE